MSNKCISCKREFGFFSQANIICDKKIELCDNCYNQIRSSYYCYCASINKCKNVDELHRIGEKASEEVNESLLSDEAKEKINNWILAKNEEIEREPFFVEIKSEKIENRVEIDNVKCDSKSAIVNDSKIILKEQCPAETEERYWRELISEIRQIKNDVHFLKTVVMLTLIAYAVMIFIYFLSLTA